MLFFFAVPTCSMEKTSHTERALAVPKIHNTLSTIYEHMSLGNSPLRSISLWKKEVLRLLKNGAAINEPDEYGRRLLQLFITWLEKHYPDLTFDIEDILDDLFLTQGAILSDHSYNPLNQLLASDALVKSKVLKEAVWWFITHDVPVPESLRENLIPCLRLRSLFSLFNNQEHILIAHLRIIKLSYDMMSPEHNSQNLQTTLGNILTYVEAPVSEYRRVLDIAPAALLFLQQNETTAQKLTPEVFLSQLIAPSMTLFLSPILAIAAGRGYYRTVEYILTTFENHHFWINWRMLLDALNRSASAGHYEVSSLLVEKLLVLLELFPNESLSFDGPFLRALSQGHTQLASYFLTHTKAYLYLSMSALKRAFIIAVHQSRVSILSTLLERIKKDLVSWIGTLEHCLTLASKELNEAVINLLLDFDAQNGFLLNTQNAVKSLTQLIQGSNLPHDTLIRYANIRLRLIRHAAPRTTQSSNILTSFTNTTSLNRLYCRNE